MIGDWPKSLFDWDILFLLPLPWWGPVLAPVCIALLMIVGGTLASQSDRDASRDRSHAHIVGLAAGSASRSRSTCSWPTRFASCIRGWTRRRPCCRRAFNWPLFWRGIHAHGRAGRADRAGDLAHGGTRPCRRQSLDRAERRARDRTRTTTARRPNEDAGRPAAFAK